MEGGKKGGKLGKAVLIADQLGLKVNIIFALFILVPLQKKKKKCSFPAFKEVSRIKSWFFSLEISSLSCSKSHKKD